MDFKLEKGKTYNLSNCGNEDRLVQATYIGLRKHVIGDYICYKPLFEFIEGGYCSVMPDVKVQEDGTLHLILDVSDYYNSIEDITKLKERPKEFVDLI